MSEVAAGGQAAPDFCVPPAPVALRVERPFPANAFPPAFPPCAKDLGRSPELGPASLSRADAMRLLDVWARSAVWDRVREVRGELAAALIRESCAFERAELIPNDVGTADASRAASAWVARYVKELDALNLEHADLQRFVERVCGAAVGGYPLLPTEEDWDRAGSTGLAQRMLAIKGRLLAAESPSAALASQAGRLEQDGRLPVRSSPDPRPEADGVPAAPPATDTGERLIPVGALLPADNYIGEFRPPAARTEGPAGADGPLAHALPVALSEYFKSHFQLRAIECLWRRRVVPKAELYTVAFNQGLPPKTSSRTQALGKLDALIKRIKKKLTEEVAPNLGSVFTVRESKGD